MERAATRVLKAIGLRDRVFELQQRRRRRARMKAEASGDFAGSWPAALEMDRQLVAIIGTEPGYFIEAGANDGYTQSNTYALERVHGWRGLLVEPMPQLAARATASRPASIVRSCALAPDTSTRSIRMSFGGLMTSVAGTQAEGWAAPVTELGWEESYEVDVPARTLSELLDEVGAPSDITLLTLDVEGFEASALAGLDLDRHAPRFMLIEIHEPEVNRPPIDAQLGDRYREHSWLSHCDLLYERVDPS